MRTEPSTHSQLTILSSGRYIGTNDLSVNADHGAKEPCLPDTHHSGPVTMVYPNNNIHKEENNIKERDETVDRP